MRTAGKLLLLASIGCTPRAAEPTAPPPAAPAARPALSGVVRGPDGAPLPGASVRVTRVAYNDWALADLVAAASTGPDGRYALAELPPGEYLACAVGPDGAVAWAPPFRAGPGETRDLALAAGRSLRGAVAQATPGARAYVGRVDLESLRYETCPLDLGADGGFQARGLAPGYYWTGARADGAVSEVAFADLRERDGEAAVTLAATAAADLDVAGVLADLKPAVHPLTSADPGGPAADLELLGAATAGARLVGLGEATHGTREFFRLKHRALEHLVEKRGFSVFLFEVSFAAGEALDAWVQGGPGDVREILVAQGRQFPWMTEEVREVFEWLRRYNLDPKHRTKVRVYGVDAQTPDLEFAALAAYLERVDPAHARAAAPAFAEPTEGPGSPSWAAQTAALAALEQHLVAQRARYGKAAGADAWARAVQRTRVILQAFRDEGPYDRDRAMAENALWALEHAGPSARAVLWAHNMHVRRGPHLGQPMMGGHLGARLAGAYVAVGFAFDRGTFRALDLTRGFEQSRGVVGHTVGPAPAGSFESVLARLDLPLALVDLRKATGKALAWAGRPQTTRSTGAEYTGESAMLHLDVPAAAFDAVVFVAESTPTTELPRKPAAG